MTLTDSSPLAKFRHAVSGTEISVLAWLGANTAAGAACAWLQMWTGLAFSVLSLGVSSGLIALFAARRSRVAAQRLLVEMAEQTRFLLKQTRQQARAPLEAPLTAQLPATDSDHIASHAAPKSPASPATVPPGSGATDDRLISTYLEIADEMPDHRWLDGTILRNASISGRDLLAWRASGGRYSQEQIEGWLARYRRTDTAKSALAVLVSLDVEWALRLARVLSLQDLKGDDRLNALTLYRALYVTHGPSVIRPPHMHALVFQAIAYQLGEFRLAKELVDRVQHVGSELGYMRADLVNPFTASPFKNAGEWLKLFNESFVSSGLEPIWLEDDMPADIRPFDRVRCLPLEQVAGGPLVSIVVSSWKPGPGLVTAVISLLTQSYRNIEILVIDDCSPDEFQPLLDQVAALDSRIRVIRQPVNGGTYMARNTAMDVASGDFITFLDSDDWNHPRRIEIQARALVEDKQLVYTTSRALRTTPDLVFCLPGVLATRENASSMMFRRELVRKRVGYFDNVRKGADSEFGLRIRAEFGKDAFRLIEQNLSIIRLWTGSLSREEFKPGWSHPSRAAYRRSYEHWHRSCQLRGLPLATPARMIQRPFQAPLRFLLSQRGNEALSRVHFDVVFLGDLRQGHDATRGLLEEARACHAGGMRVGLLHIESFRDLRRINIQPFWAPLQEALDEGYFAEVLATDHSVVEALLVREPSLLQFISTQPLALDVRKVLVVAETAPCDSEGRCWYEPSLCHRHAQAITGVRPRWVSYLPQVRKQLRQLLPPADVLNAKLPPAVTLRNDLRGRGQGGSRALVLGRITERSGPGFPSSCAELMAAYPDEPGLEVRMMGGRDACEAALGSSVLPRNWTFYNESQSSHTEFLAACDFFVLFDEPSPVPVTVRAVLEAFAAGCVVVLPPKYANVYGSAAVYCEPRQVRGLIAKFSVDEASLFLQRERGRAFVRKHAEPSNYLRALRNAMASY